ncbi:MAG: hypothetical protein ACKOL0_07280 [Solirubrobacterales bacterium]
MLGLITGLGRDRGRRGAIAVAAVGAFAVFVLAGVSQAEAEKYPGEALDLYVDSRGSLNLAVPGESEGFFQDGPGASIVPGEAGLALHVSPPGGAYGVGQATAFAPVTGPQVVQDDANGRLVETTFRAASLLEVEQLIQQSNREQSVLVIYSIRNISGNVLAVRPYLLGNLRLDSANTATAAYSASPYPTLDLLSTRTSRVFEVFNIGDPPPTSVQVGQWANVGQGTPAAGLPYSALDTGAVRNPAFGLEWSAWADAPLADGTSIDLTVVYGLRNRELQPMIGSTAVVSTVKGTVLVKVPGGSYQELQAGQAIPMGSLVDTRKGTVRLTTRASGGNQSADFRYGIFKLSQERKTGLTNLKLSGKLANCRSGRSGEVGSPLRAPRSAKAGRSLWGSGKGKFKTSGKKGSGSVRGTTWQVTDRCDGTTEIRSIKGTVEARDFTKGAGFKRILRSGQRYVAGARR